MRPPVIVSRISVPIRTITGGSSPLPPGIEEHMSKALQAFHKEIFDEIHFGGLP